MTHSVEIKTHNKWLIITVLQYGTKLKSIGTGILFSGFNRLDLHISEDALDIIRDNINQNIEKKDPVMEIIATDRMWWASSQGIIIPPNEYFHIYTIPLHTTCNNTVDDEIKKIIDQK